MRKSSYLFVALPAAAVALAGTAAVAQSANRSIATSPTTASSPASTPAAPPFEAASVVVPRGDTCKLHPEGVSAKERTLPVSVDEDGVARFQALRATTAGTGARLSLDCVDSHGKQTTYPVDLGADETFAPRPFDGSHANLDLRPALVGDPLSVSQADLVQKGYGIRPDPKANSRDYAQWLKIATTPMYELRSATRAASLPTHRAHPPAAGQHPFAPSGADAGAGGPTTHPDFLGAGWTGAVLQGSYNAGSNDTYGLAETTFHVPSATAANGDTRISMWAGLDWNVFQAIVWLEDVPGTGNNYSIARQCFNCSAGGTDGPLFTPVAGDEIFDEVWYCDNHGNLDVSGGYECSLMVDITQSAVWDCSQASSGNCTSEVLTSGIAHGQTAEFIVENDTDEEPSYSNPDEWPNFSTIDMTTSADVVQGATTMSATVTAWSDPYVQLGQDFTTGIPSSVDINIASGGDVSWAAPHKSDLSSIGTSDFTIGFVFAAGSSSGVYGVMGQRSGCGYGDLWDIRLNNGHLTIETDDTTNGTHYSALVSSAMVADATLHNILVERRSGTLSLTIDGTADSSVSSPASFGTLPTAAAGEGAVYGCVDSGDGTQPFVTGPSWILSAGYVESP